MKYKIIPKQNFQKTLQSTICSTKPVPVALFSVVAFRFAVVCVAIVGLCIKAPGKTTNKIIF